MDVVSLFCGCGGLDLGFEKAGFNVVWANDIDKYAVKTYNVNFQNKAICQDIYEINIDEIPNCDVLIGGFPCQPFSMMGEEKGFADRRGVLFFRIEEIIRAMINRGHKPTVLVFENVRNLKNHDKGRTFAKIKDILENNLNYRVYSKILNSADFGVPQTRNRTYIICFDKDVNFVFPQKIGLKITLQDLLEHDVEQKYYLSDKILPTILSSGTGGYFSQWKIDLPVARPLCATMAKMHRANQDNYVTQNGKIRRLTPRECARLQGFPDSFIIPVSDSQAYKQFGNAVTVNVSNAIAIQIKKALEVSENEQ